MQKLKKTLNNWSEQLPIFTKTYMKITIALSILATLDLISPYHMFYTFSETFLHLNLWRPITAFIFMGKIDVALCINCIVLFYVLSYLQKHKSIQKQYPDFIWLILVIFFSSIVISSFVNLYFFTEIFILSINIVAVFEGLQIKPFFLQRFSINKKLYVFSISIIYGIIMAYVEKRYLSYAIGFLLGIFYALVKYKLSILIKIDFTKAPKWMNNLWYPQLHLNNISLQQKS